MAFAWIPLKFKPILKSALWGGNNLARLYGRASDPKEKIAESWDLVDLGSNVSVVANGPLAGKSLRQLLQESGAEVLGQELQKKSGGKFPLLVKLIDANDTLSLQVHPDDNFARTEEKGQRGKSEMWYLLQSQKDSSLICGFKPGVNGALFDAAMQKNDYQYLLQVFPTHPGDVYFVPAGTIHAIGKGNLLFEIQVPSELTYRIYDWGRVEDDGKPRPTHREKARQVLRFENPLAGKVTPKLIEKTAPLIRQELVRCPDFSVEKWTLIQPHTDPHPENKPLVYCFASGKGKINGEPFSAGDTFLIPASLRPVEIIPSGKQPIELLRTIPEYK